MPRKSITYRYLLLINADEADALAIIDQARKHAITEHTSLKGLILKALAAYLNNNA